MVDQQDPQNENAAQNTEEVTPQQQPAPTVNSETPAEPSVQPETAPEPSPAAPVEPPEMLKKAADQPATKPEERVWALVSYIPMVALLALIMKPDSEFVKLHGRQGLLIFIIFFFNIFIYLVPFIGPVIGIIVHFGCMGIGLFSMYQAFIGNWWKIPVLGDVAKMLPVEAFTKVTRTAVMTEKVDDEKRAEESQTVEPEEAPSAEEMPMEEEPKTEQPQPPTEQAAPTQAPEGSEPPAQDSGADQQQ
ncbi:MAG TPA: hypothetical protein PKA32_01985 [Candidatus Gracilibacteria bacterium]|nr:hypothetical protein [Candidatus Gracilibacteria bacterium]